MISNEELSELEGIGECVQMANESPESFAMNQLPIRNLVYGEEAIFRPWKLENPETRDIFVGWKVVYVAQHVPEFEDEGIKDQVLTAWKMEKARELAAGRAEELAGAARASQKPLSEALAGQKVTENSPDALKVNETGSFSWLKTTTVPGPNPLASEVRPELSEVPFVKKPGIKFMRTIFEELGPKEVGVAVDYDASTYYVVQVKDREPSAEELVEKRGDFFNGRLFGISFGGMRFGATAYDYLSDVDSQQIVADWVKRLEESYKVEFQDEDKLEGRNG